MSRAIKLEAQRFSDQEIAHYRDNGFIAIPGLFSGSALTALTGWVDELEKFPEEPGIGCCRGSSISLVFTPGSAGS